MNIIRQTDIHQMFVNTKKLKTGVTYEEILKIQLALFEAMKNNSKIESTPLIFITTTGHDVFNGCYSIDVRTTTQRLLMKFENPDKKHHWNIFGSEMLLGLFPEEKLKSILNITQENSNAR